MNVYRGTNGAGAPEDKVYLVPQDEWETAGAPGLAQMLELARREGDATRFESHDGFDCLSILVVDPADPDRAPVQLRAHMDNAALTVVYGDCRAVQSLDAHLRQLQNSDALSPQHALLMMFTLLTQPDAAALEDMEGTISELEDVMMREAPKDGAEQISVLRRRLLALKRYYEGLFDLLEDMEENANGFFSKKQLRMLRLQTNRADRLGRTVLNLRDYVTQVREAYQNAIDIGTNRIMKVLTVITSIFMPLTLIVGWYGMNFHMPEYGWRFGYAGVVAFSLLVLAAGVWLFRKNKWF